MQNVSFAVATGLVAAVLCWPASPLAAAAGPQADTPAQPSGQQVVQLIVDYGDGVKKHFHQLKWRDKMTVQDVTVSASKHPRGIKIKQRGKKATAFLSQIDDLANNPNGRSWIYRVNGKMADRSFGVFPVQRGDVVSWTYQTYP